METILRKRERRRAMRLCVYVAGAYSSNHILGVAANIRRGRRFATEIKKAGFADYCPWNDWEQAVLDDIPMKDFKETGLAWLRKADAVVLVPGWEDSAGTHAEIDEAIKLHIPVFYSLDSLIHAFGENA